MVIHWTQWFLAATLIAEGLLLAWARVAVHRREGYRPIIFPRSGHGAAVPTLFVACWVAVAVVVIAYVAHMPAARWLVPLGALSSEGLRVLGAVCVVGSLFLGAAAVVHLISSRPRPDDEETVPGLVTAGVFGRVRNPYFASLDLYVLGVFLMIPGVLLLALFVLVAALLHLQIFDEERALAAVHGEEYLAYMRRAGRYFPRIGGMESGDEYDRK